MTDENKPAEVKPIEQPPAQPPQEDWKSKWEESERLRKEQDAKINDLTTTVQTFHTRFNSSTAPATQTVSGEDDSELIDIIETAQFDKDSAKKRLAQYQAKQKSVIAQEAVKAATGQINAQTTIEKLKAGVKSSNPEFDDEIVDVVIQRANEIAATGKFKTAEEAVNEAAKYIKSKFDAYASKIKAVPPLPAGAGVEAGSNPAPSAPKTEKVEEPTDVIESRLTAKSKKIL